MDKTVNKCAPCRSIVRSPIWRSANLILPSTRLCPYASAVTRSVLFVKWTGLSPVCSQKSEEPVSSWTVKSMREVERVSYLHKGHRRLLTHFDYPQ